jgi:hypothetical protein
MRENASRSHDKTKTKPGSARAIVILHRSIMRKQGACLISFGFQGFLMWCEIFGFS